MYQQINPTEIFRERQIALLEEAENRRLARRLRAGRSGSQQEKGMGPLRRTALLFVVAMAVVVLSSTVALAEVRIGTDASETLTGTNSADQITGKGGNDTLKGLAANDTYHFDDGFGQDSLTETASVKVGKKKLPGGIDTLNFSQVSSGSLQILMIPQWASRGYNVALSAGGSVNLGSSPVENAVGGSSSDIILGGSAKNTYKGGPGGSDRLEDFGGIDGDATVPALAASDDTYKGFTSSTGHDGVLDYGGTSDKLDLRPLESSDVYFDAVDGGTSLRIFINDTTSVTVVGHFSPIDPKQENGRMEQIIFSDGVVTSAASML